ncbi:MAG: hypothetical protein K0S46_2469 [Moraxellaceae bacterium]|jgi:hypothetical protein|nr:hypothetical protein [Moraxellaceae bacterium]
MNSMKIKKSGRNTLAVALLGMLLDGCSSFTALDKEKSKPHERRNYIYAGTRDFFPALAKEPNKLEFPIILYPFLAIYGATTVATDTVLLPLAILGNSGSRKEAAVLRQMAAEGRPLSPTSDMPVTQVEIINRTDFKIYDVLRFADADRCKQSFDLTSRIEEYATFETRLTLNHRESLRFRFLKFIKNDGRTPIPENARPLYDSSYTSAVPLEPPKAYVIERPEYLVITIKPTSTRFRLELIDEAGEFRAVASELKDEQWVPAYSENRKIPPLGWCAPAQASKAASP